MLLSTPVTSYIVLRTCICRVICFLTVVILPIIAEPQAYAQMGYGTNYSDTWLVGVNQPTFDAEDTMTPSPNGPPSTYVQGYGSVEDQYNSYGHSYSVDVFMDSPDGRNSETWADGDSYARADVTIQLNGVIGSYSTYHSTIVSCPISNTSFLSGGGTSSRTIGISFSAFYKAAQVGPNRAVYQLVTPCDVTCVFHRSGTFARFSLQPSPNYIRIGEPFFQLFGYKICENLIDSLEESATPLSCFEIGV